MVLLVTVGVWTALEKRGQEPGLHLGHQPETVIDQMNQSDPKLSASTTKTEPRRAIRQLELMFPNVMLMDCTDHCSAMVPLGIVGALTRVDRSDQEPGLHRVLSLKTVTNQRERRLSVSSTETACRLPVQRGIPQLECLLPSVTQKDSIYLNSATHPPESVGVLTEVDRSEQEPGLQLVLLL